MKKENVEKVVYEEQKPIVEVSQEQSISKDGNWLISKVIHTTTVIKHVNYYKKMLSNLEGGSSSSSSFKVPGVSK